MILSRMLLCKKANVEGYFIKGTKIDGTSFLVTFTNETTPKEWINTNKTEIKTITVICKDAGIFTTTKEMFKGCINAEVIDVSALNVDEVVSMESTFADCSLAKQIIVSTWNTSSCENMANTFANCNSVEELSVGHFKMENVVSTQGMFLNCSSLKDNYSENNILFVAEEEEGGVKLGEAVL